jgi:catechol 2,3-dioxygenase-like lactoylglutathione lyase family enzyme
LADLPRIAHVGIAVPDLGVALAFYRDVLGLQPRHPETADAATIVSLPFGESEVELLRKTPTVRSPDFWLNEGQEFIMSAIGWRTSTRLLPRAALPDIASSTRLPGSEPEVAGSPSCIRRRPRAYCSS